MDESIIYDGEQEYIGWYDILKVLMTSPQINPDIVDILEKVKSIESELEAIVDAVVTGKFNLVFLDLNLSERFTGNVFESLDYQLLQKLRKKRNALPIIVFTSSNKHRKLSELIRVGADTY